MNDLVKAVQALKLAFERRNLPEPQIKTSRDAIATLQREAALNADIRTGAGTGFASAAHTATELGGIKFISSGHSQKEINDAMRPVAYRPNGFLYNTYEGLDSGLESSRLLPLASQK